MMTDDEKKGYQEHFKDDPKCTNNDLNIARLMMKFQFSSEYLQEQSEQTKDKMLADKRKEYE